MDQFVAVEPALTSSCATMMYTSSWVASGPMTAFMWSKVLDAPSPPPPLPRFDDDDDDDDGTLLHQGA